MENRYYAAPVEQEINELLFEMGYDQLESAVDNHNEERYFIINTEDKLFWESDETELDRARQMAETGYEQQILQIDFNTISSWEN